MKYGPPSPFFFVVLKLVVLCWSMCTNGNLFSDTILLSSSWCFHLDDTWCPASLYTVNVCVYCDISMCVLIAESYRKTATVSVPSSLSVFMLVSSLRLFTIYMVRTAVFIEACCSLFSRRLYASVTQTIVVVCARQPVSVKGGNVTLLNYDVWLIVLLNCTAGWRYTLYYITEKLEEKKVMLLCWHLEVFNLPSWFSI